MFFARTKNITQTRTFVNYTPGTCLPLFTMPDLVISTWGVVETRNRHIEHKVGWKVSGARRGTKRGTHGFQGEVEPMSPYSKSLLNSMFKGW